MHQAACGVNPGFWLNFTKIRQTGEKSLASLALPGHCWGGAGSHVSKIERYVGCIATLRLYNPGCQADRSLREGGKSIVRKPALMLTAFRYQPYGNARRAAAVLVSLAAGAILASPAQSQVTEIPQINVQEPNDGVPDGLFNTETEYIPSVTFFENGLASFEALKAQAVAARTFAYFKMQTAGEIGNGTGDQVFRIPGRGEPSEIHQRAARETWGQVLTHPTVPEGETIASFYVAGGLISPFTPLDDLESGISSDPTGTEQFVTYNLGETGNDVAPTSLGSAFNPKNRGGMSQNGGDFLSDRSVSYVDILKHYYGADIQLESAVPTSQQQLEARPVHEFADFDNYGDTSGNTFDGNEGFFGRSPTFSGTTSDSLAGSTATRSAEAAYEGTHSQKLDINHDASVSDDWILRHLSGAGAPFDENTGLAATEGNVQIPSEGSVGFWLKTESEGLSASLAIDDPTTGDRARLRGVRADGEWHKYEWLLNDESAWQSWVPSGDGVIDALQVTLDSIQLFGDSDAEVFLDSVFWDPGVEMLAGDLDTDGTVGQSDLKLVLQNWGEDDVPLEWISGFDGSVGQDELTAVLANWDNGQAPSLDSVPEPGTAAVLALTSSVLCVRRRERRAITR